MEYPRETTEKLLTLDLLFKLAQMAKRGSKRPSYAIKNVEDRFLGWPKKDMLKMREDYFAMNIELMKAYKKLAGSMIAENLPHELLIDLRNAESGGKFNVKKHISIGKDETLTDRLLAMKREADTKGMWRREYGFLFPIHTSIANPGAEGSKVHVLLQLTEPGKKTSEHAQADREVYFQLKGTAKVVRRDVAEQGKTLTHSLFSDRDKVFIKDSQLHTLYNPSKKPAITAVVMYPDVPSYSGDKYIVKATKKPATMATIAEKLKSGKGTPGELAWAETLLERASAKAGKRKPFPASERHALGSLFKGARRRK